MKQPLLILVFALTTITLGSQTTGKRMTVKVYETNPSFMNSSPIIKITNPDRSVQTVPIAVKASRNVNDHTENNNKVQEVLDRIKAQGYTIKTSSQSSISPNDFVSVTTYEFEQE